MLVNRLTSYRLLPPQLCLYPLLRRAQLMDRDVDMIGIRLLKLLLGYLPGLQGGLVLLTQRLSPHNQINKSYHGPHDRVDQERYQPTLKHPYTVIVIVHSSASLLHRDL